MRNISPILILLAAFLAVYVQSSFDFFRNVTGAQFDLLPALMVYTALTHGITAIAVFSIMGGLWMDSLSANPFGVSVLPLFFVGLVIYYFQTLLLRDHPYAQFVLGLSASAISWALTLLTIFSMDANPLIGWGTIWQWIVVAACGGMVTPLLFKFFDRIERALNYQRVQESSFRPDREIKRGRTT